MPVPDGFAQIAYVFGGLSAPTGAVSTIAAGPIVALSVADVATIAYDAFVDNLLPRMVADVTLTEIQVKFGPDDTGPSGTFPAGVTGGVADASSPANVALLVNKVTSLGGRHGRGRMFLLGLDQDLTDSNGIISPAEVAEWNTALAAYQNHFATEGLALVLLHADASEPTAIDNLVLSSLVGTLKQRLRR